MNLRRLQRLFKRKWRQDGRHAFRQHRLARARRPDHQNVVTAGASNFQSSLGCLLPANIFKIHDIMLGFVQQTVTINFERLNSVSGIYKPNDIK